MKKWISLLLAIVICIGLLPVQVFAAENPFTDVIEGKFYYDAVLWAVGEGITTGKTATTFDPSGDCTRAQVVTFLWRYAGKPGHTSKVNPFPDVPDGKYYTDAVLWAVEKGITAGFKDGTFGPDKTCTRGQIVTFLWRFAGEPAPKTTENPFPDVDLTSYCGDAVLWAVENGITAGYKDGTFGPDKTCTRDQIVTFLYRYMNTLKAEEKPEDKPEETKPEETKPEDDEPETEVPLTITMQPSGGEIYENEWTALSVTVSGGKAPYTYQWMFATSPTGEFEEFDSESSDGWAKDWDKAILVLQVGEEDFNQGWRYCCVITDARGAKVTSNPAFFTEKIDPLEVKTQPADQSVAVGTEVQFTVGAIGGKAPYTYAWEFKTDDMADFATMDASSSLWAKDWNTATLTVQIMESHLDKHIRFRCVIADAKGGKVTSNVAAVTELVQPLAITAQPSHKPVYAYTWATLSVGVSGGKEPYTYQWMYATSPTEAFQPFDPEFDNVWAENWDTDTLTLQVSEEDLNNSWRYCCVITDAQGSKITSDSFTFTEKINPMVIDSEPSDITVKVGDKSVFTVVASGGTEPYSYQWQFKNKHMADFYDIYDAIPAMEDYDTADLTVTVQEYHLSDAYEFRCVITDSDGNTIVSKAAKLVEYKKINITKQPVNVYALAGDTVRFEVETANGYAPHTYRWQFICSGMSDWEPISQIHDWATLNGASLQIKVKEEHLTDAYRFRVIAADYNEETVESDVVMIMEGLYIASQPLDAAHFEGQTVQFDMNVQGGGLIHTYKWQYKNDDLDDYVDFQTTDTWASNWDYPILSVTVRAEDVAKNQCYRCVVTDEAGNKVISNTVKAEMLLHLSVKTQPKYVTTQVGETVSFAVEAANGVAPYTYQWMVADDSSSIPMPIPGETDAVLTVTTTELDRNHHVRYYCVITDSFGETADSDIACPMFPLQVTKQPTSAQAMIGDIAYFYAKADFGYDTSPTDPTYRYQWEYFLGEEEGWSSDWMKYPGEYFGDRYEGNGTSALQVTLGLDGENAYALYRCAITEIYGDETIYTDVVSAAEMMILMQPANAQGDVGDKLHFAVTAVGGTGPYTYQWQYRTASDATFTDIPVTTDWAGGMKSDILTVQVQELHKTATYFFRCVITDYNGIELESNEATILLTSAVG